MINSAEDLEKPQVIGMFGPKAVAKAKAMTSRLNLAADQPLQAHISWRNRNGQQAMALQGGINKCDPNDPNDLNGAHELHVTTFCGNIENATKILDSKTVRLDVRERNGREPLHYAALSGHCEMIELLLSRGAKIKTEDDMRMPPLFYASALGKIDAMKLLLEKKAVADHRGKGKVHILHETAGAGHLDALLLLAEKRAEMDAKDSRGVRPIDLAYSRNGGKKTPCAAFLEDWQSSKQSLDDASKEMKKNKLALAAEKFKQASTSLVNWEVPRTKLEILMDTASCQLRQKEFDECMALCRDIQKVNSATPGILTSAEDEKIRLWLKQSTDSLASLNAQRKREDEKKAAAAALEAERKAAEAAAAGYPARTERWTCPGCDEVNKPERTQCNNCGGSAPAEEAVAEDFHDAEENHDDAVDEAVEPIEVGADDADEAAEQVGEQKEKQELCIDVGDHLSSLSTDIPSDAAGDIPRPLCVVCLGKEATIVGKQCGHLAWCSTCRRTAVFMARGEKGSKSNLSARQLDRTPVSCPVCRVEGCIVIYNGRIWHRGGGGEVFVPIDEIP